ncbi:MAG TPA: carboxypeptidase regulatory-like domain-containing protein [Archangium sp.]|nr:carboxypeptidase regulatory-like domain-containing protein [Archangium sp.]
MRRGWVIGAAAGLLALLLWLVWRPTTAPEPTRGPTDPSMKPRVGTSASASLWSNATPSEARGTLSIQGRVVGPRGPVPGVLVVALAPASRQWPSLTPPPTGPRQGYVQSCEQLAAALPLLERAAELRGQQMPKARATTDAQGNFRLEGLEAGAFVLWAERGEDAGLRGEVAAGSEHVEVRLGPGRTFSGGVYDEQGRPAAGALVTTLQRDAGRFVETSTDEEGRFLLGPLPWGRYDVLVSKAGLVPARLMPDTLERGPVQVTLPAPRRISGQVTDERGPVPGVTVEAEGGTRVPPSVTDARGHFRLEGLCPGKYVLTASHAERFARQQVSLETGLDKESAVLVLGDSVRLSGRVTGSSGQPLEGALVIVFADAPPWREETRTDARGGFLFERLVAGKYTVMALAAHHERLEVPPRLLLAPEELRLTLKPVEARPVAAEGASLEVEWVDAAGRPVLQAPVRLDGPSGRTVTTGMDGRAVFQGLAPGRYFVEPQAPEGWIRYAPLAVELRGTETRKVRLQPEAGWNLSGEVVDAEGNPLEGVPVVASRVAGPGALPEDAASGRLRTGTVQAVSGPEGGFTLANLPEGPCALRVMFRGYGIDASASRGVDESSGSRGAVEVSPGSGNIRLVLRAQARVRGRVVREDGGPITSFRINLEPVSHPEGRFSLPMVGNGRTWVFDAPGFSQFRQRVASPEDEDLELDDVVLVEDRTVRGRVLEAGTSAPIAGAWVQVSPSKGYSPGSGAEQSAYTLPDGSFTVEGVKAGEGVLRVVHPDWPPVRTVLAAGQREVMVVLEPGATLEGRIELAGTPVRSGVVRLRSEQGEVLTSLGFWEGRYSLRAVPAGRYLLHVVAYSEEGPAPLFPVRQVALSRGDRVTLDFTEQVEGALLEVFVPERNIEVHLIPGNLPLMGPKEGLYSKLLSGFMGKPVREGVRRFPRLPAGSYTLFAMRRDEDVTEVHREELELPDEGEVAFTLLPQWSLYDD